MNKAMLSQDYRDAGANRVVSVLEELREAFLRKAKQARAVSYASEYESDAHQSWGEARAWEIAADDIALFIQREQRHD